MSNALRIKTVADVPAKTAAVLATRRRKRREITDDTRWSAEYRAVLLAQADQEAKDALAAIQTGATEAAWKVRESLAKPADARTTEAQMLAELKAERAFRRIERRLDAGADPLALIREAADAKDRALLAVLRDELPTILAAKGRNEQAIRGALQFLEASESPLLSDGERAARTTAADLERAEYVATMAANHAAHELETGQPVTLLASADGRPITVGE